MHSFANPLYKLVVASSRGGTNSQQVAYENRFFHESFRGSGSLFQAFAKPSTTPPAMINAPPSIVEVDGGWWKNTHDIN
jgi:hypothetical protein